jgi:hypothetical protein
MMHSQSLHAHGKTQWVPYVVETFTHAPDVMDVLNTKHESVHRVIANMTPSQTATCHSTYDLNVFFPQVGLFLSEFLVGTVMNAAIKKEKR